MSRAERRRFPGICSPIWCRHCKKQFLVAGRQQVRTATPTVELVVCPLCKTMRRMVLPPTIGAPFRAFAPSEPRRDD